MKALVRPLLFLLSLVLLQACAANQQALAGEPPAQEPEAKADAYEGEISRYPVPTLEEMPEDIRAIAEGAEARRGFVPNVVKALAHRPEQLRAFMTYAAALEREGSGLTAVDREMLIVSFSAANSCMYCMASHGAALRLASEDPYLADMVAANYREADITPRQKAMIEFGLKLTLDPGAVEAHDLELLKEHGFSDEDIWDIAAYTAFFNMSNRMMSFLAVRPDAQFYDMGR